MSTLQVSTAQITTLTDGTNSVSSTVPIRGSAKVWVNFAGNGTASTNQTIRASYNVSTVFKTGAANYLVNFTNSLPDANYCVVASCKNDPTTQGKLNVEPFASPFNLAVGSVSISTQFHVANVSQTNTDCALVTVAIFD